MFRIDCEWATDRRGTALTAVFLALFFCFSSHADESVLSVSNGVPVSDVASKTSDVFVAQNALRDGLNELAEQRALAVLASSEADATAYGAAFSVLMSVYEHTRLPGDWLEMFEEHASEGVAWPSGDGALLALRDYWHARALVRASQFEAAVERLIPLVDAGEAGDAIRVSSVRLLAYVLNALGRVEASLAVFEAETNAPPDIVLDHARVLVQAGLSADAIALLDPVVAMSNEVETAATAAWLTARALGDAGMQTEARLKLAELVDNTQTPPDFQALALAAMALSEAGNGDTEKNIAWAEEAVGIAHSLFVQQECRQALALVLAQSGHAEAAVATTRDLVVSAPRSLAVADLVRQVADILLLNGFYETALDEYDLYLSSFSGGRFENAAQKGRGLAFSGLGRHAEAATAYLRASELADEPVEKAAALFLAAEAQYTAGFNRQALSTIEVFRALSPGSELQAEASLLEAECRVVFDPNAALRAFVKMAEVFSGSMQAEIAIFRAGQLQAEQAIREASPEGEKQAIEYYARAAESTNVVLKASAMIGIGLVRLTAGDYAKALVDFESVAEMKGVDGVREQAQLMRAEALLALRRPEDAVAAALELLKKEEDSPWRRGAVFWMGRRSFNTGDFEQAARYFAMYVDHWPDEERADLALLFQAQAQFQRKLYREAIEPAMKLVARNPEGNTAALAQFIHAEALTELLQFDAAVLLYDVVVRTAHDDTLRLTAMARRGDCLFTLGADNAARYSESIDAYEKVLSDPAHKSLDIILQCEYKIGRSLDKAGRTTEAAEQYYANVISRFEGVVAQEGLPANTSAQVWYARAILGAADIFERMEQWAPAVSMLARVVGSAVPGAEEAARRMLRIKNEKMDPVDRVVPVREN